MGFWCHQMRMLTIRHVHRKHCETECGNDADDRDATRQFQQGVTPQPGQRIAAWRDYRRCHREARRQTQAIERRERPCANPASIHSVTLSVSQFACLRSSGVPVIITRPGLGASTDARRYWMRLVRHAFKGMYSAMVRMLCGVAPLGPIEMAGKLRIDPRHSIRTDSNVYEHGATMSSYTPLRRALRSPVGAPLACRVCRRQHIASRVIGEGIDRAANKAVPPRSAKVQWCATKRCICLSRATATCGRHSCCSAH